MKNLKFLVIAALLAVITIPAFAQTPQEIELEGYLPKNPITKHVVKAITGAATIIHSGAGTSPVVAFASPTLTIGSSLATYSFTLDGTDTSVDTLQELVASVSSKTGWTAALGDQFKGTESTITDTVVNIATVTAVTAVSVDFTTASFNYGTKLYLANKTPSVFRMLWTNTFSSGTSYMRIYRGTSANSNTNDTLVLQVTSAATTVEKELNLTPYMVQGLKGGYLKFFVENSANQSAGVVTLLGAYR